MGDLKEKETADFYLNIHLLSKALSTVNLQLLKDKSFLNIIFVRRLSTNSKKKIS